MLGMEGMTVICVGAALLSLLCLALLVPVYGRLFFSTHTKEWLTLEEHMERRKMLGLEPQAEPEQAEETAEKITEQLFPKENLATLTSWANKRYEPEDKKETLNN